MNDFDALTKRQREVLGCIAINEDGMHHPKVLAALESRGFIESYDEVLGGRFPVRVKRWVVPIHVHIAWCEWCSRQT